MGWALMGALGPYGPGPYGLPWALVGWALVGPLGPLWAGPLWAPCGPGLYGPLGPLWAGPLRASWALTGRALMRTLVNQRLGSRANPLSLVATLMWRKAIYIYIYL